MGCRVRKGPPPGVPSGFPEFLLTGLTGSPIVGPCCNLVRLEKLQTEVSESIYRGCLVLTLFIYKEAVYA